MVGLRMRWHRLVLVEGGKSTGKYLGRCSRMLSCILDVPGIRASRASMKRLSNLLRCHLAEECCVHSTAEV